MAGVWGRNQGAASQCSPLEGLKGVKRETKVPVEETPSPRKTKKQGGG